MIAKTLSLFAFVCFASFTSAGLTWTNTEHVAEGVAVGETVEASFEVVNATDDVVVITQVKPSCGCTVATYDQAPLQPGEARTIRATFTPKKEGAFRKPIYVTTTASAERQELAIVGTAI